MGTVLGNVLPLALGIAISPIPIIAAILMLLSPKARVTSVGFLVGWIAGIVVAVSIFSALSGAMSGDDGEGSQPVIGTIQLVLGALLVLLAARQWRGRPRTGDKAEMPAWMGAIDSFTFGKALGLGALLSGVNPKNLILGAAAGMAIGAGTDEVGTAAIVIVVFTVIAASTVLIPVVGYLVASERLAKPLASLRDFLRDENAIILTVLLLVIGVTLIGKAMAHF